MAARWAHLAAHPGKPGKFDVKEKGSDNVVANSVIDAKDRQHAALVYLESVNPADYTVIDRDVGMEIFYRTRD